MPAFFLQRLFCVVHWQNCKTKQITYKNKSDHIIMIWSDMLLYVIVFVLQICQCTKQNRRWRKKAGISPVPMMFCFESMAMGLWAEAVWTGLKHMCQHQSKPITSLNKHKKWYMVHMMGFMCLMHTQTHKLAHQQQMHKQTYKLAHHKQRNPHNML